MLLLPVKKGKSGRVEEQMVNPNKFMGCKAYIENEVSIGVIFYIDPITFKGSLVIPKFTVQDILDLMAKAEMPIGDFRENELLFRKANWVF